MNIKFTAENIYKKYFSFFIDKNRDEAAFLVVCILKKKIPILNPNFEAAIRRRL